MTYQAIIASKTYHISSLWTVDDISNYENVASIPTRSLHLGSNNYPKVFYSFGHLLWFFNKYKLVKTGPDMYQYLTFWDEFFDHFIVFKIEIVNVRDAILDVAVLRLQVLQFDPALYDRSQLWDIVINRRPIYLYLLKWTTGISPIRGKRDVQPIIISPISDKRRSANHSNR